MTPTTDLYFEAHVTIDPVDEEQDVQLEAIAASHDFRVAELLMKKTRERSRIDSFMTGRGTDYEDLKSRTEALVEDLTKWGFIVRRWKLENTLLDQRLSGHVWWDPSVMFKNLRSMESCKNCGRIKRKDGKPDSRCPGKVGLALR